MLKYKYISEIKYTEDMLSNSTQKLLWFGLKLPKCWWQFKNALTVLFIIIFGTISFAVVVGVVVDAQRGQMSSGGGNFRSRRGSVVTDPS